MVTNRLKQRVVGVLVLIALAVVLFPVFFDMEPRQAVDTTTLIPPSPDVETTVIEKPQPALPPPSLEVVEEDVFALVEAEPHAAPVDEASDSPDLPAKKTDLQGPAQTVKSDSVEVTSVVPPRLAESGLPEAWVIQVASYQEAATATALVDKLKGRGYKAFVRSGTVGSTQVHRVYVGPMVLKSTALEEKAAIDRQFKVHSLVLPFKP